MTRVKGPAFVHCEWGRAWRLPFGDYERQILRASAYERSSRYAMT